MLLVYGVQFYKHISSILHPTDASHCPFTRCPLKLLSEFTAFHRHPEPPIFISKDPDSALNPDPALELDTKFRKKFMAIHRKKGGELYCTVYCTRSRMDTRVRQ